MKNKNFKLKFRDVVNIKFWDYDSSRINFICHWDGINLEIQRIINNEYGIFLTIKDYEE